MILSTNSKAGTNLVVQRWKVVLLHLNVLNFVFLTWLIYSSTFLSNDFPFVTTYFLSIVVIWMWKGDRGLNHNICWQRDLCKSWRKPMTFSMHNGWLYKAVSLGLRVSQFNWKLNTIAWTIVLKNHPAWQQTCEKDTGEADFNFSFQKFVTL